MDCDCHFPYCENGIESCCIHFGKKLLNLIHGIFRFIVFLLALAPFLTIAYLIQANITSYVTGYSAAISSFLTTWTIIRTALELFVCMAVMADTIVSTDSPFGYNVDDYTFFYLAKIPPPIVRGFLWLLLSSFSSKEVVDFFSSNYTSTVLSYSIVALDTARRLLIFPGVFLIIFSIVRFRKTIFTVDIPLIPTTREALDANHWDMTRYYERKKWREREEDEKKQRIKQRLDKILFLISPIFAIASHCFKFYLDYSVIASASPSVGITLPGSLSSTVQTLIVYSLYYIDLVVPYLVHLIVSILLIIYICILLCYKHFIPFHWQIKVLMLYNLIATMPSASTLTSLVTLNLNSSISTEAALWISACVPFLVFLPAVPYFFTRSPAMLIEEISGIFRTFLQFCLNFINPSKLYRTFHVLTIIFGVCGLLLLLLGLPLSWMSVNFNMNVDMLALRSLHVSLDTKMISIDNTFENVLGPLSCIPLGNTIDNTATLEQLKTDNPECFDGSNSSSNTHCPAIVSAYNNATDTTQLDGSCISDTTICAAFLAMIIAGFALTLVPFAGGAGKAMVLAARIMKKMFDLTKTLNKIRSKVKTYKTLLTNLYKVLSNVIVAVVFALTSEYLLIILPCVALGAICLSVGFWKRKPLEGIFSRSLLTGVSTAFLVTNIPIGLLVWFAAPLLGGILDIAPLFDVTVTEHTGWLMIKAAYLCSAFASILLFLYSTGDFVIGLLTRLCCGCTCCTECTAKCRRYADKDADTDVANEEVELTTSDDTADLVDSDSESRTERISSVQEDNIKESLLLTKVYQPSAWFMPLVPALFAGLLIAFVFVYQPSLFIIYTRLNGETSALQAEISVGSERVSDGANTMDDEKTLCDLITTVVTAPFLDLFSALTPSIVTDITTYIVKLKSVFTIPTFVSLDGWGHLMFSALPGLACLFFIIGFIITLMPCCSDYTKSLILSQIKQLILVILLASLSFSLTAAMAVSSFFENLPLVEITATYGLAIQLSLLANFILLLAWVELNISSFVPII